MLSFVSIYLTVNIIFLDDTKVFSTSGFISGWRIWAAAIQPIALQVWRPNADGSYTLVGQNTYTSYATASTAILPVATADQIQVQAGDRIGWMHSGSSSYGVIKFTGSGNLVVSNSKKGLESRTLSNCLHCRNCIIIFHLFFQI
jgi:hypothetical protein